MDGRLVFGGFLPNSRRVPRGLAQGCGLSINFINPKPGSKVAGICFHGPMDGNEVEFNYPGLVATVRIADESGNIHVYLVALRSPAPLLYSHTERPKATKLAGGMESVESEHLKGNP